jgi:hypothetical protein
MGVPPVQYSGQVGCPPYKKVSDRQVRDFNCQLSIISDNILSKLYIFEIKICNFQEKAVP